VGRAIRKLQCVAVCCSVLQLSGAIRKLQCVAMCCNVVTLHELSMACAGHFSGGGVCGWGHRAAAQLW